MIITATTQHWVYYSFHLPAVKVEITTVMNNESYDRSFLQIMAKRAIMIIM